MATLSRAAMARQVEAEARLRPTDLCSGRGQRNKKPCTRIKGWGTEHLGYGNCRIHGGNTPAGKAFAARELAEELRAKHRKAFGGRRIDHEIPEAVLLEEVARSAAMVRFLEEKIGAWPEEYRTGTGLPRLIDEHYSQQGVTLSPTERAGWLTEYRNERKHLVMVTQVAISAKLSDRVVNLAERTGYMFAQMLRAAAAAANLDADQARRLTAEMPRILSEAASGTLALPPVPLD